MTKKKAWQSLTLAVLTSMVLATPAYAEVSRSEAIGMNGKTVASDVTKDPNKLKIETGDGVNSTTTTTTTTTAATTQEEPKAYRTVRKNGVTFIEKVSPETIAKEKAAAKEAADKAAKLKAAEEERHRVRPGRSVLSQSVLPEGDLDKEQNKLNDIKTKVAPYIGTMVTKVDLVGKMTKDKEKIKEVLKMRAGSKITQAALEEDLKSLYETGWFYEISPTFNSVPEGTQVFYNVQENPVFKQLDVEGNTKISTVDIKKMMNLPENEVLNTKTVNEGARKVESEYSQQGYILAKVSDVRMLPDGHLAMQISEGVIEDFRVRGNTKTRDKVILRELKLKKGEPFNAKLARRSMQRIFNLGYFEDVNIKLNPGQFPNTVSVEVAVVETSTGTFGIGAGYSSADGFIGMVTVGDKNFRGTGDSINVRWEFGGDSETDSNFEVTYVKPWIDNKETTASFTFYSMTNEYIDYDRNADEIARYYKKRVGEEIGFSRVTDNEFITNSILLKNRDDKYVKPVSGYNNHQYYEGIDNGVHLGTDVANARRTRNFGTTRSITFGRTLDTRDNIYDPKTGKRNSYAVEVANFGGDFNFEKYTVDYRYYYRAGKNNVLAFNWAAGYANGDMPLSQRFCVGGSDTLRGYKDDQFKGNSMLRGSLEFRKPLIKKVEGVVFTDAGYAWSKDYDEKNFALGSMKYSVGLGLRVNSPLGPIRLDYGFPLRGEHRSGRFHFSFGGQF
jgi:outer membrane protein insertion porin family